MRIKFIYSLFILPLLFTFSVSPAFSKQKVRILKGDSVHVSLGIPRDKDTSDDYVLIRRQYALSYNKNIGIPNWVSYELNKGWFGEAPRYSGNFITDTALPQKFFIAKHNDYTNSGFDRGHMVRSEERTRDDEDNRATFLMSNIIPQRPDLNRGPWLDFEYHCENLCKKENKQLYIITGPIVGKHFIDTNNRINYPDSCFKIVVVLDSGNNISNIDPSTTVIAVAMPNVNGIRKRKWESFTISVRRIEELTGYDFLNFLPKDLQDKLELIIYTEQKNGGIKNKKNR